MALSGHPNVLNHCPLLGVRRTSDGCGAMSVFDPKRGSRHNGRMISQARPFARQSRRPLQQKADNSDDAARPQKPRVIGRRIEKKLATLETIRHEPVSW